MNSGEIRTWRGRGVERAVNLEAGISAIVCQHDFGHVPHRFLPEVTYDQHLGVHRTCRLLDTGAKHPRKARWMQDLGRHSTIRSCVAHGGPEMRQLGATRSSVPVPHRPGGATDFGTLRAEFERLAPGVETFLAAVFEPGGGELLPASPAAPGGDDGEDSSPASPALDTR